MTEDMKVAWLEIEQMLGETTREEFDVFLRTWQRAVQATRKTLAQPDFWEGYVPEPDSTCNNTLRAQGKAYPRTCAKCKFGPCVVDQVQPAQRPWRGLTDEERKLIRTSVGYNQFVTASEYAEHVQKATEAKLRERNT